MALSLRDATVMLAAFAENENSYSGPTYFYFRSVRGMTEVTLREMGSPRTTRVFPGSQ